MFILFAIISYIFLNQFLEVLPQIKLISLPIQSLCLVPFKNLPFENSYNALICGKEFPQGAEKDLWIRAGLYHLIVVSGAHLSFIQKIIEPFLKTQKARWFQFFFILGYALMGGWNPPLVRAFFESTLKLVTPNKNSNTHIFSSWVLTLVTHPQWISSLSLSLSTVARLAIGLTKNISSQFKIQAIIFFLMLPLISKLSAQSLWVSLLGLMLAPFLLFCLSTSGITYLVLALLLKLTPSTLHLHILILKLFKFIQNLFEPILKFLFLITNELAQMSPIAFFSKSFIWLNPALYTIVTMTIFHGLSVYHKQKKPLQKTLKYKKNPNAIFVFTLILMSSTYFTKDPILKNPSQNKSQYKTDSHSKNSKHTQ